MKFILFLILATGTAGPKQVTVAEFDDRDACENAVTQLTTLFKAPDIGLRVTGVCVAKSSTPAKR